MRHNSHRKQSVTHAKRASALKRRAKNVFVVPLVVKKHPASSLGLATLGLGVVSGLIWYNIKK